MSEAQSQPSEKLVCTADGGGVQRTQLSNGGHGGFRTLSCERLPARKLTRDDLCRGFSIQWNATLPAAAAS